MIHVLGKTHIGLDTLSRREVTQVTQAMVTILGEDREMVARHEEDSGDIDSIIEAIVAANIPTPKTC